MVMCRRGFEAVLHSLGARGLQMHTLIGQWFTILDVDSALREAGLHAHLNDAALSRMDARIFEVFDFEQGRSPTPGAGGGARLKRRRLFGPPPAPLPPAPAPPAPVPRRRLFGPPAADPEPPAPADPEPPTPAPADPEPPAPADPEPPAPEMARSLQRWKTIAKKRQRRVKNLCMAHIRAKKKLERAQAELARLKSIQREASFELERKQEGRLG